MPGEPRMNVKFFGRRLIDGIGGSKIFHRSSPNRKRIEHHLHLTVMIAGLLRTLAEFHVLITQTYDPWSDGAISFTLSTPSLYVRIRSCVETTSDIGRSSFNLVSKKKSTSCCIMIYLFGNCILPLILQGFTTFTFTFQDDAIIDFHSLTLGKSTPIDRTFLQTINPMRNKASHCFLLCLPRMSN